VSNYRLFPTSVHKEDIAEKVLYLLSETTQYVSCTAEMSLCTQQNGLKAKRDEFYFKNLATTVAVILKSGLLNVPVELCRGTGTSHCSVGLSRNQWNRILLEKLVLPRVFKQVSSFLLEPEVPLLSPINPVDAVLYSSFRAILII
jgi:hypothetical protein